MRKSKEAKEKYKDIEVQIRIGSRDAALKTSLTIINLKEVHWRIFVELINIIIFGTIFYENKNRGTI